ERNIPKFFRGDAAFASPKLITVLEAEGYWYAIRLKANAVLERHIAHLLKRPVGRPSKKPKVIYHSFRYQAKSWDGARRVAAKVEWHAGELFSRVGFVVTNLRRSPKRVVKFYNGRGTAELHRTDYVRKDNYDRGAGSPLRQRRGAVEPRQVVSTPSTTNLWRSRMPRDSNPAAPPRSSRPTAT